MLARSTAWRHGRRPELGEGDVDEQDAAVAHHEVGRLDVAMGEAGVPQDPDEMERLVDERLVDLCVAELDRALEELGHQHVLPLGRELDEAVRLGAGRARFADDAQRVVLLLDQPTHGVERLLVLQPPVQQLPTELVPAVRAQVGARVELAEQVRRRRAFHPEAQRRRAGRLAQPHGLDLGHGQAELVLDRLADGLTALAADVEVRGPPPAVRHGEDLARREEAKGGHREADADEDADHDRARRVDAEMEAGQRDERDDDRDRPTSADCGAAPRAPACRGR